MLFGPIFVRELRVVPRRIRHYVSRALYTGGLLLLLATFWLFITGNQRIVNLGDISLFGTLVFQFLAPLQLALALLFAALFSVGTVAQEKDRGTLTLLLMTRLSPAELVLGKLSASLLGMFALLLAAFPVFLLLLIFGGASWVQVVQVFLITLVSMIAAGSLGGLLGFWREKTFQAVALAILALVAWIGGGELLRLSSAEMLGITSADLALVLSPYRALEYSVAAYRPVDSLLGGLGLPVWLFLGFALLVCVALNAVTMWNVRGWTTAMPIRKVTDAEAERETLLESVRSAETSEPAETTTTPQREPSRAVWGNPILWREIRTWAYGKKVLLVRGLYVLLAAILIGAFMLLSGPGGALTKAQVSYGMAPLLMLSLLLINALAVNSFCNERDGRTLDLLLVTDLSPQEFLFGKILGVFYNTKEMILVPVIAAVILNQLYDYSGQRLLTSEQLGYLLIAWLIFAAFVTVLGIHSGMAYNNSRTAGAVSLGTLIFLFFGIISCMRMIIAFDDSFTMQFSQFAAFILGGGVALFAVLGVRNPSPAIFIASMLCPFATFYGLVGYSLEKYHLTFWAVAVVYAFATVAMFIPAISEFDIAIGKRTEAQAE